MNFLKSKKGQIPIAMVITIGTSLLLSAFGAFMAADAKSQDRDYEQIQRISALEARIERLPAIEAKIDAMLWKSGISPIRIEESLNK